MNRSLPIVLCIIWAAVGYAIVALVMPHIGNPITRDVVAALIMVALLPIVYGVYWFMPFGEKAPSTKAMKFSLLLLYKVSGVSPDLIPEEASRIQGKIGMTPAIALQGTRTSKDRLTQEYREIVKRCTGPDHKSFDPVRINENATAIRQLITDLDASP